jgi:hypothetical protein
LPLVSMNLCIKCFCGLRLYPHKITMNIRPNAAPE